MVANKLEGKKAATATPKKIKAKSVTPSKRAPRVNRFLGKVKVSKDEKNGHFDASFWKCMKVEIDTKTPSQAQRKSHLVGKGKNKVAFFNPSGFDKKSLAAEVRNQLGDFEPFLGRVFVMVHFYYKLPTRNPTSIKKLDYYAKKPDIDNLQKFLFDSLGGLFYKDDCQLVHVNASKMYDDRDHVEIIIASEKTSVDQVVVGDSGSDSDDDDVDLFELNRR